MNKTYQIVVTGLNELPENQEIELAIRDFSAGIRKYDGRYVRAIIARSPDALPDGDRLRVVSSNGYIYPVTWAIRITEELGPYPSESGRS